MSPTFTVITATYNCAHDLPALAASLQAQSCKSFEWIVVDGRSTDGTLNVIKALGSLVTKFISEPDQGIYDAWNKGLNYAKGEWILFLGADDAIGQDWLTLAATAVTGVDLIYGDLMLVDRVSRRYLGLLRSCAWEEMRVRIRQGMHLPHPGLVHRRSLFASSKFDTRFRLRADYDFVLRAKITRAAYIPHAVQACMTWGGESTGSKNVQRAFQETLAIAQAHGLRIGAVERLRWMGKCLLSRFPRLYARLQRLRWHTKLDQPTSFANIGPV